MPASWPERAARAVLALSALVAVGTLALVAHGPTQPRNWAFALAGVVYLGVGVVGLVFVQHAPRNALGWLLLAGCLGTSAAGIGGFWSEAGLLFGDPRFAHPEAAAALSVLGTMAAQAVTTVGVLLSRTAGRRRGAGGRRCGSWSRTWAC